MASRPTSGASGTFLRSPINPNASKVTRLDQGVDIASSSPFLAVAGGTVVHIDPNFWNGTPAVYVRLDHPVTVNGRTYGAVYYSETKALVHVGQHVNAGDPVTDSGVGELGFASRFAGSWLPSAHGVYTEGVPTQAGKDFYAAMLSSVYSGAGEKTPGVTKTITNVPTGETTTTSGPGAGFFSFLDNILNPAFWLRVVEVMGGGFLILLGLYLLAKQVGLASSPPPPVAGPAARAGADVADTFVHPAGQASGSRPGRRSAVQRHEVSESADRRRAVRERAERAQPSDEIPF